MKWSISSCFIFPVFSQFIRVVSIYLAGGHSSLDIPYVRFDLLCEILKGIFSLVHLFPTQFFLTVTIPTVYSFVHSDHQPGANPLITVTSFCIAMLLLYTERSPVSLATISLSFISYYFRSSRGDVLSIQATYSPLMESHIGNTSDTKMFQLCFLGEWARDSVEPCFLISIGQYGNRLHISKR